MCDKENAWTLNIQQQRGIYILSKAGQLSGTQDGHALFTN